MSHFEPAALEFLADLAAHNDRDWFSEHRKTYEQKVRDPFKAFVSDVIAACAEREPAFADLEPKHCIFRINRDTRFSKDKQPYKTHLSAGISPGGKKSGDPGLYVHFDAGRLVVGGGAYWVEKDDLYVLREHIAAQPERFNELLAKPTFKSKYGALQGERNVRLPKEFRAAAEVCPHILNKQFFYMAELPVQHVVSPSLVQKVMEHFDAAAEVRQFLRAGLQAG
jgi:uncharacterized protein (TIGR02453 family)